MSYRLTMDTTHELSRMNRNAARRPGLTPLQARLVEDDGGAVTRRAVRQFKAMAQELADKAVALADQGKEVEVKRLHRALTAAADTLARHWELLHGRPLPPPPRPLVRRALPADAATRDDGPDAVVDALGECAVLAAMAGDVRRGEAIRSGIQAVAPDRRAHDVPYALALSFNGEGQRAEVLLNDLMRCRQEEARAASAYGFVLQTRGDERWRAMFARARRAAIEPEVERFVAFWTAFADAPQT